MVLADALGAAGIDMEPFRQTSTLSTLLALVKGEEAALAEEMGIESSNLRRRLAEICLDGEDAVSAFAVECLVPLLGTPEPKTIEQKFLHDCGVGHRHWKNYKNLSLPKLMLTFFVGSEMTLSEIGTKLVLPEGEPKPLSMERYLAHRLRGRVAATEDFVMQLAGILRPQLDIGVEEGWLDAKNRRLLSMEEILVRHIQKLGKSKRLEKLEERVFDDWEWKDKTPVNDNEIKERNLSALEHCIGKANISSSALGETLRSNNRDFLNRHLRERRLLPPSFTAQAAHILAELIVGDKQWSSHKGYIDTKIVRETILKGCGVVKSERPKYSPDKYSIPKLLRTFYKISWQWSQKKGNALTTQKIGALMGVDGTVVQHRMQEEDDVGADEAFARDFTAIIRPNINEAAKTGWLDKSRKLLSFRALVNTHLGKTVAEGSNIHDELRHYLNELDVNGKDLGPMVGKGKDWFDDLKKMDTISFPNVFDAVTKIAELRAERGMGQGMKAIGPHTAAEAARRRNDKEGGGPETEGP